MGGCFCAEMSAANVYLSVQKGAQTFPSHWMKMTQNWRVKIEANSAVFAVRIFSKPLEGPAVQQLGSSAIYLACSISKIRQQCWTYVQRFKIALQHLKTVLDSVQQLSNTCWQLAH